MTAICEGLPNDFRVSLAKDNPKTLAVLQQRVLGLEDAYLLEQKLRKEPGRSATVAAQNSRSQESADSRNRRMTGDVNKIDDSNMATVIHKAWLDARETAPAYCATNQAREDYATNYVNLNYSLAPNELDAIVGRRSSLTVNAVRDMSTIRCRACGEFGHFANNCTREPATKGELMEVRTLTAQSVMQAEETKRQVNEQIGEALRTMKENTRHFDERLVAAESSPSTALASRNAQTTTTPAASSSNERVKSNSDTDTGARHRRPRRRRSGPQVQQLQAAATPAASTQFVIVPTPQYQVAQPQTVQPVPMPQMQQQQQFVQQPQQFTNQQQQQGQGFQRNRYYLQPGQVYCSRCRTVEHHFLRCPNPIPGGPCTHCLHPRHSRNMCNYSDYPANVAQQMMSQRNDQSASGQLYADGSQRPPMYRGGNRGRGGFSGYQGYQGGQGFSGSQGFQGYQGGRGYPAGRSFYNSNAYGNRNDSSYAQAEYTTRRWPNESNQQHQQNRQQLGAPSAVQPAAPGAPQQPARMSGPVMMVREMGAGGSTLLTNPKVSRVEPRKATAEICGLASVDNARHPPMLSHCLLPCKVVGQDVVVYVDTGSGVNIMGARIFKTLDPRLYHYKSKRHTKYVAANDTPLVFIGQVTVQLEAVDIDGKIWSCYPTFNVCEGFQGILLGTEFVGKYVHQITWSSDGPRMSTKPRPVQDHITGLGPYDVMTIMLEQYVPPHVVAVVLEDVYLPKQSIGHIQFGLGKNIYSGSSKQATCSEMLFESSSDFSVDSGVMLAPALIARNVEGIYFTNAINATTRDRRFRKGEVIGLVRADDMQVTPFLSSGGKCPTSPGLKADARRLIRQAQFRKSTPWYRIMQKGRSGDVCSSTGTSCTPRRH